MAREGVHAQVSRDGQELMTFIHPGGHVWPAGQTRMIVDFFRRQGHGAVVAGDQTR